MVGSSNIIIDVEFLMYVVRTVLWNLKKKTGSWRLNFNECVNLSTWGHSTIYERKELHLKERLKYQFLHYWLLVEFKCFNIHRVGWIKIRDVW